MDAVSPSWGRKRIPRWVKRPWLRIGAQLYAPAVKEASHRMEVVRGPTRLCVGEQSGYGSTRWESYRLITKGEWEQVRCHDAWGSERGIRMSLQALGVLVIGGEAWTYSRQRLPTPNTTLYLGCFAYCISHLSCCKMSDKSNVRKEWSFCSTVWGRVMETGM